MKKKMMKALRDLNDYIDDDRQKLSDRFHALELSHNRKKKALLKIMRYIERECPGFRNFLFTDDFVVIHKICEDELSYPYLRANWTTKGGKNV